MNSEPAAECTDGFFCYMMSSDGCRGDGGGETRGVERLFVPEIKRMKLDHWTELDEAEQSCLFAVWWSGDRKIQKYEWVFTIFHKKRGTQAVAPALRQEILQTQQIKK